MAKRSKSALIEVWSEQLATLKPYMILEDCATISANTGIELQKVRNAVHMTSGQAILPIVIKELTHLVNERIVLTEESQAQINQMLSTTVG